jgi:hypothetical protein
MLETSNKSGMKDEVKSRHHLLYCQVGVAKSDRNRSNPDEGGSGIKQAR